MGVKLHSANPAELEMANRAFHVSTTSVLLHEKLAIRTSMSLASYSNHVPFYIICRWITKLSRVPRLFALLTELLGAARTSSLPEFCTEISLFNLRV
jgi:hypothetical protein